MAVRNYFTILIIYFSFASLGQRSIQTDWYTAYNKSHSFIENKGQFDENQNEATGPIRFCVDFGSTRIFFGEHGVSYSFLEAQKIPKAEREKLRASANSVSDYKKYEKLVGKFYFKKDEVNMTWSESSSKSVLVGLDQTTDYHNYSISSPNGTQTGISNAKGFKKIVYKNIYDNIDIEYTVHPQIGIKYALIVHPGGDPSLVGMHFDVPVKIENGELKIPTKFGDIIDHAPLTFYEKNKEEIISSSFKQEQNTIHFQVGNYNKNKTIIIDPWTQTPAFASNWDVVWECERDGAGNVYILGGIMPMQILKYNPAGTLQWTYNTPYDTSNVWLGTFAVDNAGNAYVTAGSVAQIQKISPAGALLLNNPSPGGILSSAEFWTISFNCDQTALIIGGTGGALLQLDAVIYNVNTNTLNISNQQFISTGPLASFPPDIEEVRSITAAPNGKYYFMTQDTIGYMNDNFTLCPAGSSSLFKNSHNAAYGYKCEDFRYDNSGICALAANGNAVYMHKGNELQKRSLSTGAILQTVAIPGGAFNSVFLGGNNVSNSGIALDNCGNIYVGSTTGVYKFNSSLVQQAFYPTSFKVYDIAVNTNGEIIACGGTGNSNSGTRSGGVQTFAASACAPIAATCCDASICVPQDVCVSDGPITLTTATPGGTWSGPGVNSSGVFNPATAGVGSHSITYTLSCGSETITILVSSCQALQICQETNGNITVSGGVGPYTWQQYTPASSTPITNQSQCQACGYTWFFGTCLNGALPVTSCNTPAGWTTIGTGSTITPPSGTPQLQVIDNTGNITPVNLSSLPACGSVCPTITVSIVSQTNISCFGQNTGAATVNASGGSGSYTYTWSPGNLSGASQTNLGNGSYTVAVTDANNCPGTTSINITQPAALQVSVATTPSSCSSSNGSATASVSGGTVPYSYQWSPGGGTNASITNLSAGSYTLIVTDALGCQVNESAIIAAPGAPTISLSSSTDVTCFGGSNGTATVTANGGTGNLTIGWSPGNLSGTSQTNLSANNYVVTATDANGCSSFIQFSIDEPTDLSLQTGTITAANCGANDGAATVIASGGTSGYTYAWTPIGGTSASATNLASGSYIVNVTDANGCQETLSLLVTSIGGPTLSVTTLSNVSCFGENDGSATVSANGTNPPFNYTWLPNGGTAATALNLSSGTYTVGVTDALGCVGSTTVTITEPPALILAANITASACGLSNGSIDASASGGTGPYNFVWLPNGQTGANINNLSPGQYTVIVTDANGCTATETYPVDAFGSIPITVTPTSTTIQEGDSVLLAASGALSYSWSPSTGLSCDTCATTYANPNITTIYTVTGTDAYGCTGTADILVIVQEICGNVFVPTVLSPDGTGNSENKMACVYGKCIVSLTYAIYDRWGEKVFETSDQNTCWDGTFKGKKLNAGAFAYKLKVTLSNSETIEQSGNVTLIR